MCAVFCCVHWRFCWQNFLNKRGLISNKSKTVRFSVNSDSKCDKELLPKPPWEAWTVGVGVGHRSSDYGVVISDLCHFGWVSSSIMHFGFADSIESSAERSLESKDTRRTLLLKLLGVDVAKSIREAETRKWIPLTNQNYAIILKFILEFEHDFWSVHWQLSL